MDITSAPEGRRYGVPSGLVSKQVDCYVGVDGHVYMSEGKVVADEKRLQLLAEARARRGTGRSALEGMSGHARRAFYRTFFGHVGALETLPTGFVTLTHGKEAPDWQVSKAAFNRWQQSMRDRREPVCGTWVAELQQRGAVHYHVCLSVEGDAAAVSRLFDRLRKDWLRITGDEGSLRQWRERRAYRLDMVGARVIDRERLARYLEKANLAAHQAKAAQKGSGVAYGRTWGVIRRERLARYYAVETHSVHPGDWVARAVAMRRVLHEVKGVNPGRGVDGPVRVVPVKLWGVGLEGEYLRHGRAKDLGRLFGLVGGSWEWMAMVQIHEECMRREPDWMMVRDVMHVVSRNDAAVEVVAS